MAQPYLRHDRLTDLERTLDTLNGRIRAVQWELQQTRGGSLERLWKQLTIARPGNAFMSAVCNKRARPNTKVDHADAMARP